VQHTCVLVRRCSEIESLVSGNVPRVKPKWLAKTGAGWED
jgi:hypothetical protein